MKETRPISFVQKHNIQLLGSLFWALYFLGTLFPDFWWTTHWLAFVPTFWKFTILSLAGLCMIYPFFQQKGIDISGQVQALSDRFGKGLLFSTVIGAGILFYTFPIAHDYFGDAFKLLKHVNQHIDTIPPGTHEAFFTFSLSPWEGHSTILALVTYIAYYSGSTYGEAFLYLDLICGCLFVLVWLSFLRFYLKKASSRLILGLAGVCAPCMLIFFGHTESYAPVFLCFTAWLVLLLIYLENKSKTILWSLIPLLLLCLKLHPVALLFIPALGLLFLDYYAQEKPWVSQVSAWKGISRWIITPIFSVGASLYFFVFKDYNDPRSLNETAMEFDRLFLPILSPDPPLEKYNMLSFNHIFDFFSEVLLWSPIALFILVFLVFLHRNKINWHKLSIRLMGLSLLLFTSLFFVINPLLSMQMDWDLMAIPAPIFLIFTVLLLKEVEEEKLIAKLIVPVLGISLLTIPSFFIHAQADSLSKRYESLGIRMYHTYYEWSGKVIQFGLNIETYDSRASYEKRKEELLVKLKPHTIPEKDFEYAFLLIQEGKHHLRVEKDYTKALDYLKRAEFHFPRDKNGVLYLMETHFLRKEFTEAFRYSQELMRQHYPSEKKSIAIAVQCALEAGLIQDALDLASNYVKKWEDNTAISKVKQGLESGIEADSLKRLFSQPK